jgi:L-threonylcarbamoyladenylate synthase
VVHARGTWEPQVVVNERIGLRWSTSPVIAKLLETTSFPVTATSANLSGGSDLDSVGQIAAALGESIDLYLDAGELKGLTSTVVDCSGGSINILREGAIPAHVLTEFFRGLEQE